MSHAFLAAEDASLKALAHARMLRKCGAKGFSETDLNFIAQRLGHRNMTAVKKRFQELGFEHAKATDYVSYVDAGWCLGRSNKRRISWLSMGVKPWPSTK